MNDPLNRRAFLKRLAALGAVAAVPNLSRAEDSDRWGATLPRRVLGKTGKEVTLIGLGGFHVGWTSEPLAQATIEAALEEGVRFFDTAESYSAGLSESRYGKFLVPKYRDEIFLMTKTTAKDAATAREHLEGSLQRLKTDYLDLWQLHALSDPEDVEQRFRQGVVDVALKALEEGRVRHLGFTGHASPYAHLKMLEMLGKETPFAVCQMPVNVVDAAARHSFTGSVMPRLQEENFGILAMKTLADGRFFGRKVVNDRVVWEDANPVVPHALSVEDATLFALSLPISVAIVGAENPDLLREKTTIARKYHALTPAEREALLQRAAAFAADGKVEYYKNEGLRG